MLFREDILEATQREWEIDCYSVLHYVVVMKYAKIEIKDKTLFVQTQAERMERKDEKKSRGRDRDDCSSWKCFGTSAKRVCTTL